VGGPAGQNVAKIGGLKIFFGTIYSLHALAKGLHLVAKVDIAVKWEVSRTTIYDWRAEGCPVDGTEAEIMAWLRKHRPERARRIEQHLCGRSASDRPPWSEPIY
jgi:hypothetical protein